MTEEFLHYIWKYRLFDNKNLQTQSGEPIEIIKPGEHNTDAGPDFFNARIKIGKTLWAGNVEIHIRASEWNNHNHNKDKAYDNAILHVVYEEDKNIFRKNGELLPTLVLKERISRNIFEKYLDFKLSKSAIPCEKVIDSVSAFHVSTWLDRMLTERLERKSTIVLEKLKQNKNNWEETFYQLMARNFGFKLNAEPFELLAKSLSNTTLAKHKDNFFQIEALLFGQAGLLEKKLKNEYPLQLQKEYNYLRKKLSLSPIDEHLWKFLRLRPSNFPTIRLSQFAKLVFSSTHLFSKIIEIEKTKDIRKLLSVEASAYWENHYVFDKLSVKKKKHFGDDAVDNVIINTIVPVLFIYGKQKRDEEFIERALKFLEQTRAEKNSIITKWNSLKIKPSSAYQTQALIELKNEYCSHKKCLSCAIGNKILSK